VSFGWLNSEADTYVFPYRPKTSLPRGFPPCSMSKKTSVERSEQREGQYRKETEERWEWPLPVSDDW